MFSRLLIIIFFLLTSTHLLFSQSKTPTSAFNKVLEQKSAAYKSDSAFAKAHLYYFKQEWDSTLVYTNKILSGPLKNTSSKNYVHFFRGNAFQRKGLNKEAEKEYLKITTDFAFYKNIQLYLGIVTLEQGQYKKALDYFATINTFTPEQLKTVEIPNIEENIGITHIFLKQYDKAKPFLERSIQHWETQKDTTQLIGTYGNIAASYYEQYEDDLAITYFTKAYNLAKGSKDFHAKASATNNMAVVEENRENYKAALAYHKELEQWKDSLNDQNKIYEVAQVEKQFAISQKQKEVSLLQAENRVKAAQRNGLLFSAVVLLALLLTGIYFYREKIKSNRIITEQKETLNALNATKDKLFSIVSHDLRSSVNALKTSNKSLITAVANNDHSKLKTMLQSNSGIVNGAYNLLDNLLNWALLQTKQSYFEIEEQRLFFIAEHVAYNYLAIMQEKKIAFNNTVKKNHKAFVDQESLKIILRNLIDNAIKFTAENGSITIYSNNENPEYCLLIVEDTGMGMKEETRIELVKETTLLSKKENEDIIGTGLGLQLCKSMIKKNLGKFNIESTIGKGTKMIVSLPKTSPNG